MICSRFFSVGLKGWNEDKIRWRACVVNVSSRDITRDGRSCHCCH
jgi:hypothetical protein